jgi:hypothetical protein
MRNENLFVPATNAAKLHHALRALERRRKRPLQPKGRICIEHDCDTVLSTYNRSPLCWTHEPRKVPKVSDVREAG